MRLNRVIDAKLKLQFVIVMVLFGIFHPASGGWANGPGEMPMDSAGYVPQEGFVPDEATAMLIAHAVLARIYGHQKIDSEQPFRAELKDGVWTVQGSLPKDMAGGVAIIKLLKSDGRVLYVQHGA
jgi:hypothetical protein